MLFQFLPGMCGMPIVNKSPALRVVNFQPVIKGKRQWPNIKGSELCVGVCVGEWSSPTENKMKPWDPVTWVCFFPKFKKKLSEGLSNNVSHRRLRMDLLSRRLNWSSWGSEFRCIRKQKLPVPRAITQGLFSFVSPTFHVCLWNTDYLKSPKY